MKLYKIEYENDTGPMDESFWEWWSVIDCDSGDEIAKCDREADAKRIIEALTALEISERRTP